jgi:hypothetical protein
MRAEIDEQGGSLFDTGDRAETVLVVGDLVIYREVLGRRLGVGRFERTGRQVTPGRGGVRAHCYQYAPAGGTAGKKSSAWPGVSGRIRICPSRVDSRFRAHRLASGAEVAQYPRKGGRQPAPLTARDSCA